MKKVKTIAAVTFFSLTMLFSNVTVYAQDTDRTTTTTTADDDDDKDYGWIGLLGLAGLAGLMKRDKHVHVDHDRRTGTNPVR